MRKKKDEEDLSSHKRNQLTRRELLTRAGAVGLGVAAAPLLGHFQPSARAIAGPAEQTITVTGISSFGLIRDLLPDFTKETGIRVNLQILPYAQLRQNAMADLIGGTARSDVYTMDIVWLGEWATNKYVRPLDDLVARDASEVVMGDVLPGAFNALSKWNEKIWSMPFGAYYFLMYYRADWFQEKQLSVPVTFDDYDAILPKLTDPQANRYGIAMAYQRGTPIASWYLATYAGSGGKLLSSPPKNLAPTLESEHALTVLRAYLRWMKYAPPGVVDYHWFDQTTAMQTGKIGMAGTFSINGTEMAKSDRSVAAGHLGYTYMPRLKRSDKPVIPFGGWSIAINARTEQVEPSWKFLKWVASKRVQSEIGLVNGTPMRYSALRDPELQKRYSWLVFTIRSEAAGQVYPDYRPRYPFYPKLEEALALNLNRAALGQETPERTLAKATEEIRQIIKEAGYPVS